MLFTCDGKSVLYCNDDNRKFLPDQNLRKESANAAFAAAPCQHPGMFPEPINRLSHPAQKKAGPSACYLMIHLYLLRPFSVSRTSLSCLLIQRQSIHQYDGFIPLIVRNQGNLHADLILSGHIHAEIHQLFIVMDIL